jgi:cytochrome P450
LLAYNLLDPGLIEDPYPLFRALQQQSPVWEVPGTEVYLVTSWQLITQVLKNQRDYSANLTGILVTSRDGAAEVFDLTQFGSAVDAIANADEPAHSVHRKLVLPQLTERRVAAMELEIRQWSRQRIDAMKVTGGGDWQADVADPVPVLAMARLVGLPLQDLDLLLQWAFSGGEILAGTTTLEQMAALGEATAAMSGYLREKMLAALDMPEVDPAQDILGELARGVRAGLIDLSEAVSILVVLVGAAGESTSSLAGSAVRQLAQDAGLQQRLREDPGRIADFVEEVVRLESPFKGHYRVVLRETSLDGFLLPVGARVMLMWAAANRDPAVFDRPELLDIEREKTRDHLGFGQGIHFCVGARLARLEARIMVEELLMGVGAFRLHADFQPQHIPSIFVRRLARLPLLFCPGDNSG